ncbi:hypothetical protein I4U23_002042 [Adineta vaga]|nr:hypothetical protein I4U23_002042 [Adineta vaga]
MYPFNACINSSQDDTDVTIINHSFIYNQNDEPIDCCLPVLRRLQQANQTSTLMTNQNDSNNKEEHTYINQDLFEVGKQLEQILDYYRKEFKQDSNNQFECNQQLIIRLIDTIRPLYSADEKKIKDLDILFEDISQLHEKRFIEHKEKNDQLQNKIRHLKKSIISPPIEDNSRNSLMNDLYRLNAMVNYEQWIEIEEETRKLHNLIKIQRDQIDTLIELLSEKDLVKTDEPTCSTEVFMDNTPKKCSLCDFEFPLRSTDDEIIQHFEACFIYY